MKLYDFYSGYVLFKLSIDTVYSERDFIFFEPLPHLPFFLLFAITSKPALLSTNPHRQ
jgi:hypothetical protein